MDGRALLGEADVDDRTLAGLVAALLGEAEVELTRARVEPVEYALATLTTAGRYRVRGEASAGGRTRPFSLFVKVVRSVTRADAVRPLPPPVQQLVADAMPWWVEPAAYRSPLAGLLPAGLRMPRCTAVVDLDEESAAIWLEDVEHDDAPWDVPRYAETARVLGRFAADARVAAVDGGSRHPAGPHQAAVYVEARLRGQFLPAYADEGFWSHPLVRAHVDAPLRARVHALVDALPALVTEAEALPLANAHGDACPQNLLVTPDGLVAVDWGFWSRTALGFDLTQLLISEIDLGRAPAEDLPRLQTACLPAYRAGLADAGVEVGAEELRRAHAVLLAVAFGVSALPVEHLDEPATPALHAVVGQRVAALRHVLAGVGL